NDVLGEELAPGDLDPEVPLQSEDDVQEVDRLRPEVPLERGVAGHVLFVDSQSIDQRRLDFLEDLFMRRHNILRKSWDRHSNPTRETPSTHRAEDRMHPSNRRLVLLENFKATPRERFDPYEFDRVCRLYGGLVVTFDVSFCSFSEILATSSRPSQIPISE